MPPQLLHVPQPGEGCSIVSPQAASPSRDADLTPTPTLREDPALSVQSSLPLLPESDSESDEVLFKKRPSEKQPNVVLSAFAGTVGSVLAEVILYPADVVRLHVQTSVHENEGFIATAARILRERGMWGFVKGLDVAVVKETVHSFNFWLWHGLVFRKFLKFRDTSATHPVKRLLLNMVVKQLNWVCTVPFEVISQMNQLAEGDPGFAATCLKLYGQGGWKIFYRGLPVSLLLSINPAIMHTLITTLLSMVAIAREALGEDYFDAREHSSSVVGAVTGVAKLIATVLTYPLIRVKILQQTRGESGVAKVMLSVFRKEGVRGLYRGIMAICVKAVLWNSVMMAFKHALGPKRHNTPPGSPKAWDQIPTMPNAGREPFPLQLVTEEKLEAFLRWVGAKQQAEEAEMKRRISRIGRQLEELGGDLREVQEVLSSLLKETKRKKEESPESTPRTIFHHTLQRVAKRSKERPKVTFAS